MKLEIEITEEELRSAVERKVRIAVANQTNQWNVDAYIKEQVKKHWQTAVDSLISECLNDSAALREKIRTQVEQKLRTQVAAAIKLAK